MKHLSFAGIPSLAIAEGATTPAPGYTGLAWSTTTSALMRWNGTSWNAVVNGTPIKPSSITIDSAGSSSITVNGSTSGSGTVGVSSTTLGGLSLRSTQAGTTAFLDLETTPGTSTDSGLIRLFRSSLATSTQTRVAIYSPNTATETASLYADGSARFSTSVTIGNGLLNAAPAAGSVVGTSGSGTNISAADLIIQPGRSTGSGTSGAFSVKVAGSGAAGTALNTAIERLRIADNVMTLNANITHTGTSPWSLTGHGHSTFTATVDGFVPNPGTATGTKFMRDDGTWQVPAGGGGGVTFTTSATVAAAGTDQASATALTSTFNFITTGTGGVRLPAPSNGSYITVVNHTTAAVNLYPSTSGTIDGAGSALAIAPGNTIELAGSTSTDWIGVQNDIWDDENQVMTMPQKASNPASPPAGHMHLFARPVANRIMPAFMGPSGLDSALQPLLARNKVAFWNPPGNGTTAPGVFGFGTPTLVSNGGTALVARNVATTNILTRMKRAAVTSTATAGTLGSFRVPAAQYTTGDGAGLGGFMTVIRFGVSDAAAVAGARMFIGMSSSTGAATNVEPSTLTNCIGVAQLSTDNTQYYLVYGGSAAQTAVALGTSLGAPTNTALAMELALFSPPSANGVINYQVTNLGSGVSVSGTITPGTPGVQTPANTTLLTHQLWRTNNATALTVGLDICSIYVETDT